MAARRTYNVPLADPPDWVNVAVELKEVLSDETSNPAGAVAVILAVNPVPEIGKDCEAEDEP